MKQLKNLSIIMLLSMTFIAASFADVAVIANKENTNSLDKAQIKNIFLGKLKTFPSGDKAVPVDIATGDAARAEFFKRVLGKSESNVNSYWARMIFSSKGKPPKELESSEDIINYVLKNKSAIGYVDAEKVDSSVKVLLLVK